MHMSTFVDVICAVRLCAGSASAERLGQGEVGGGSHAHVAVVAVCRNTLVGTGWSN